MKNGNSGWPVQPFLSCGSAAALSEMQAFSNEVSWRSIAFGFLLTGDLQHCKFRTGAGSQLDTGCVNPAVRTLNEIFVVTEILEIRSGNPVVRVTGRAHHDEGRDYSSFHV